MNLPSGLITSQFISPLALISRLNFLGIIVTSTFPCPSLREYLNNPLKSKGINVLESRRIADEHEDSEEEYKHRDNQNFKG